MDYRLCRYTIYYTYIIYVYIYTHTYLVYTLAICTNYYINYNIACIIYMQYTFIKNLYKKII